ncbi:uncharacterized protein DUF4253 [Blastococcus colisei]|uniref:Uncharacterized protein DUF4253 n=1 Tax=Blastococcus colisei TaxID=1564162 RepID=A0A543PDH7_9ACTN|nr:DUF4253 domain-containing protein [Blastococcus colisei]TQN42131.1 uncharacterized protein DUF4253 [Blastococcus colisei]
MSSSRRRFHPSLLDMPMSDERIPVPLLSDVDLPSSVRVDLPAAGRLRLGDVDLGVGRPAVARGLIPEAATPPASALWLADRGSHDAAAGWRRLVDLFPGTGLWPLVLTPLSADHLHRPWDSGELEPIPLADVDALRPETVLAEGWADSLVPIGTDPYVEHLRPFGAEFPGLSAPLQRAAPPASVPADAVALGGWTRIGLVPCRRPADAVASIGWHGAINSRSAAQVSAVLRSWEERFGVVLAGLGFATLTLLVPRPPRNESEALPIAAELAALCPDVLAEDGPVDGFGYAAGGTVAGLAELLVDRPVWKLWWD